MADLLGSEPALERKVRILQSIPGVSSVTAAGLLATVPELADLQPKALSSLAGLAPVTRQSGTWQGRSFIQGGRWRLRRLLYMPALVASRHNPQLAAALLREDRAWSPLSPPVAA